MPATSIAYGIKCICAACFCGVYSAVMALHSLNRGVHVAVVLWRYPLLAQEELVE